MPKKISPIKKLDFKTGQVILSEAIKVRKILNDAQKYLEDALFDLYTSLANLRVGEIEDASNTNNLYSLSYTGAMIFSDCGKKIVGNPELSDTILKLAAFCFPYSPSPNIPLDIYFDCEKNYLSLLGVKNCWGSYSFFLNKILFEKSISVSMRLSYLSGALKFAAINAKHLTYDFVEKILSVLSLPQTVELWRTAKSEVFSVDLYTPNYQILFNQSADFWDNRETHGQDRENWMAFLEKGLAHFIETDKIFIEQHHLVPASFFDRELKKFVEILPDFINKLDQKKEKEFYEKISIFLDKQHSLFEFFSTAAFKKKIDFFLKKSEKLTQYFVNEEENQQQAIQKKKEAQCLKQKEMKEKEKILQNKREKEKVIKEKNEKNEKRTLELIELVRGFLKSLRNAISYIEKWDKISKNSTMNKLKQQFKTEFGKLQSELGAISKLLDLTLLTFIDKKNISLYVDKIENKINELNLLDTEKHVLLMREFSNIQEVIKIAEQGRDEKIRNLKYLIARIGSLKNKTSITFETLANKENLSLKQVREFNQCKQEIENLSKQFYCYVTALEEYNEIVPIPSAYCGHEMDRALHNISNLKKIFEELSISVSINRIALSPDNSKVHVIRKKHVLSSDRGTYDIEKEIENLSVDTMLWYSSYADWEKEFKARFFQTLEVLHRVSHITFDQGRGKLASIFIRKLEVYQKEIQKRKEELLTRKSRLDSTIKFESKNEYTPINSFISDRLEKEERELENLVHQYVNYLLPMLRAYGLAEIEFYTTSPDEQNMASQLLKSFEKAVLSLKTLEAQCTYLKVELLELLPNAEIEAKIFNIKKEALFQKEKQRDEQYQLIDTLNKKLYNAFISSQQNHHSMTAVPSDHRQVAPLQAVSVITVPWVPVLSVGFFPPPMPMQSLEQPIIPASLQRKPV